MPAQNQSPEREKGTELYEILQMLVKERTEYGELLNRISTIGHKLRDTNYPQSESKSPGEPPNAPGLIGDLHYQLKMLSSQNAMFLEVIKKLESIV